MLIALPLKGVPSGCCRRWYLDRDGLKSGEYKEYIRSGLRYWAVNKHESRQSVL